jgi:hypothetical protein
MGRELTAPVDEYLEFLRERVQQQPEDTAGLPNLDQVRRDTSRQVVDSSVTVTNAKNSKIIVEKGYPAAQLFRLNVIKTIPRQS